MGKLPFVSWRDDGGRGCAGGSRSHFAEPGREASWTACLGLQKAAWPAVGKRGPAPALPQTGCVGSGRCFVLSGSPVSHRSGESLGWSVTLKNFGQFLSNKAGRECSREKEPSLQSYTPGVISCLRAMRKALGALFLSLVNPSFQFGISSNVILSFAVS